MTDITKNDGALAGLRNAPSWRGLGDPDNIFASSLDSQSAERREFVVAVLESVDCNGIQDIRCFLDYDHGTQKDFYQGSPQGRYLVETDGSGSLPREFVLQVKKRIDDTTYLLSNRVFDHLRQCGVEAPALIPLGEERDLIGSFGAYRIAATSYIEGQHPDPEDVREMGVLGQGAARLKNALETLPGDLVDRIIENTQERDRLVRSGINYAMNEGNEAAILQMVPLMDVALLREYAEILEQSSLEICHGDCVPSNVLITDQGKFAVLDFDDMNFLPEGIDLGMMTARTVLDQGADDVHQDAFLLQAVVEGYNGEMSEDKKINLQDLCSTMEDALSYKALLALGMVAEDMESDVSAQERFEAMGGKFAQLVDRIDRVRKYAEHEEYDPCPGDVPHLTRE